MIDKLSRDMYRRIGSFSFFVTNIIKLWNLICFQLSNCIGGDLVTHRYLRYIDSWDESTFREFMQEFGQDVWNYAYFLTKRKVLADDITQEVFIKAYYHISEFRGQSSVKTWLLTITRNMAFNIKRSAYIRKVLLTDRLRHDAAARSAEQEVMDQWRSERIWSIVMELPSKYREVIVLDAFYKLPLKEIGELLQIPEGTVKSRLFRAREKVQIQLKEELDYGTV